jgi:DMSO reductase family type II enzyme molybdopterin subunit
VSSPGQLRCTRRQFLAAASAATLLLSIDSLCLSSADGATAVDAAKSTLPAVPEYRTWEDLYRRQWRWDQIVHNSHECNCNNACSWSLYVRDGIVWREEQTAASVQSIPGLPDFNPQGCQKGATHSHQMYSHTRIKYPLKRVGERGSGRWERISWDQALSEIATQLIEIIRDDGHDTICCFAGTQAVGVSKGGVAKSRFIDLVGGVFMEVTGEIGDSHNGAIITAGRQGFDGGSDTRMYSKCLLLWTYNPAATRIPDCHHLWEARYHGATVISISPDYNPSAVHADYWVNPKPGTDPALALAMANVIVRDKLYDVAHMKEQTDLPFLVRDDTRRLLRAADVEAGGRDDVFYVWDLRRGGLAQPPGTVGSTEQTLRLNGIDPALEGAWTVPLRGGQTVTARPVFERLKAVLQQHAPDFAARVTGVSAGYIERITREYAARKPALIHCGWGLPKLYHGDLLERALILLSALTGNTGTVGGGFWTGGLIPQEGVDLLSAPVAVQLRKSRAGSSAAWLYVHAGLREVQSRWIPTPGAKSGDAYIMEAIEQNWMPVFPPPGRHPRALIECGSNILRRARMNHIVRERLWPKLKLVLTIDFRMNSTAMQSDYILPAASWYETTGIKYTDTKIPYFVYRGKAVNPVGESRDEWAIFALLSKKMQQLAPQLGVTTYADDLLGITRDLRRLHDEFTADGKWPADVDGRRIVEEIVRTSTCYQGVSLDEMERKGVVSWANAGPAAHRAYGKTGDYEVGKPFTPATDFTEKKLPWPTLTGRQQFYIDHAWFLEFGEELPVHRDPPKMGGNYPLRMTCGHTRWGIHSQWRDNALMLRLQRGQPILYINPADAGARGITDGAMVEVFNDVGRYRVQALVTPAMQPGQVHTYHAWETFMFPDGQSHAGVFASQLKPLGMVGNYGHLFYAPMYYQPNNVDKGTCVDVRRA